jgi:dGTPase
VDVLEHLNLTAETRAGIGGHSKGRNDLTAHDGIAVSTLEAAIVRIADRVAYLNHDLDDAIRSGIVVETPSHFLEVGATHGMRIGAMVCDIIENSLDKPAVQLSPRMLSLMNDLKEWLFENVYSEYPRIFPEIPKAKHVVTSLFEHFLCPENAPEGFAGVQGALDYVAGMTDRFAIDTYVRLFVPESFAVTAQRSE